MKKDNLEIGKLGEKIAKEYLENKGYSVIDQNYKNKYAETDIIAKHKGVMVFVEVKTRVGEQFGAPEDALNRDKKYRLVRNAQAYIVRNIRTNPCNYFYRIDAICIVLNQEKQVERINHYQNVT